VVTWPKKYHCKKHSGSHRYQNGLTKMRWAAGLLLLVLAFFTSILEAVPISDNEEIISLPTGRIP
jgi:hypothetical protein